MLFINEAYQLFMAVKSVNKIKGDIAEVGVYQGGSAKLICEARGDKPVHLFDTFTGIPEIEEIDAQSFFLGQYAASLEDVKIYLQQYKNVFFHRRIIRSILLTNYHNSCQSVPLWHFISASAAVVLTKHFPATAGVGVADGASFKAVI